MRIFKQLLEYARHNTAVTSEDIRHQVSNILENNRHDTIAPNIFEDIRHELVIASESIRYEASSAFEDIRHEVNIIAIDLLGNDIG